MPGSKKEHKYNDSSETEGETLPLLGPYQNVMLSEQQLLTLRQEFPDKLDAYIERLSAYMAQSGKRYASHAAVLRQWMIEDTKPKCQYHYDHVYEEGECL